MGNRVTTGRVRLSYAHLFEPVLSPNGDLKYSVTILIPKKDTKTHSALLAAEKVALEDGKTKYWKGKVPIDLKPSVIHDGDSELAQEKYPEYAGHWYLAVSAGSSFRPKIVDSDMQPILDPSEVYSGCYARVSVTSYPYNKQSKGVGFGLGNVQKLADGTPFSGGATAEEDFASEIDDNNLV